MKTENKMAADVIGSIIAEGMSICDFKLGEEVERKAVNALDEIKLTMHQSAEDSAKLEAIEKILDKYI